MKTLSTVLICLFLSTPPLVAPLSDELVAFEKNRLEETVPLFQAFCDERNPTGCADLEIQHKDSDGDNRLSVIDISKGTRFGPTNPGPLPDAVANTFRGSSYTQITLSAPVTLYRVSGGRAEKIGQYWTTVRPLGPLQARIDLALKPEWGNTATQITTVKVPAGQTIYLGPAAPQGGAQIGGGCQVFIPRVDPSWVVQ